MYVYLYLPWLATPSMDGKSQEGKGHGVWAQEKRATVTLGGAKPGMIRPRPGHPSMGSAAGSRGKSLFVFCSCFFSVF